MARKLFSFLLALTIILLSSPNAFARCGGMCLYETGIPDQGASAAGASARAEDAATTYTNPAGMTRLEEDQVMFGASLLYLDPETDLNLDRTTTALPGETNEGGHYGGFTPLGGMYLVKTVTEDLRVGLAFGGSVGGSVDYDSQWIGRQWNIKATAAVLDTIPTIAYQLTDKLSMGVGVPIRYAILDYKLRAGPQPDAITVELEDGDDWGVTAVVGLLYEFSEDTRVGLVYQAPTDLSLGGDVKNRAGLPITFDANLDQPQGVNLGLYQRLNPDLALLADVAWTDWSEFDYQGMRVGPLEAAIPREFKDTWRIGAGLQYHEEESCWTFRGGMSYDSSAASDSKRLPDLPLDWSWRNSIGVEYDVSESVRVGSTYTFAWVGDGEYDQVNITPDGSVILDGETDNNFAHFFGLSVNWIFG